MLRYSFIFFIIAITAGIFGFGNLAGESTAIAKVLFYIFNLMFIVTLLSGSGLFKKGNL